MNRERQRRIHKLAEMTFYSLTQREQDVTRLKSIERRLRKAWRGRRVPA